MLQPSQDKSKILYDAVSKDYDIGSYDEFSSKLQSPEKRKAFYEGVGKEYALGSYEEFESKVAPLKKKDNSNATAQNQKSASETNIGSLDGVGSNDFGESLKTILPNTQPKIEPRDMNSKDAYNAILQRDANLKKSTEYGKSLNDRVIPKKELPIIDKDTELRNQIIRKIQPLADQATTITDADLANIESDYNKELNNSGFQNAFKSAIASVVNPLARAVAEWKETPNGEKRPELINTDNPLKKYEDIAVEEATKENKKITQEEKTARAKELFFDNRKSEIIQSRLNDVNHSLTDDEQKIIKNDRFDKIHNLGKENKSLLKNIPILVENRDETIKDIEDTYHQILDLHKANQPIPEDLKNQFKTLQNRGQRYDSELNSLYQKYNSNKKDLGTFKQEYDVYKTENNRFLNDVGRLGNALIGMGGDALDFGAYIANASSNLPKNEVASVISELLHAKANDFHKQVEDNSQYLQHTSSVEDASDFIDKTLDFTIDNIPMVTALTLTGGVGVAGMAATTAGAKYGEMANEDKSNYSQLQKTIAPALYGATMVAPMLTQLNTIRNGARVVEAITTESPELLQKSLLKKSEEILTKYIPKHASSSFKLANELKGMEFLQEGVNHFVLGKDIDYKKLADAGVYETAPLLHAMNVDATHLLMAETKPFMSVKEVEKLDNNSKKLFDLYGKLQDPKLDKSDKAILQSTIDAITKDSQDLVKKLPMFESGMFNPIYANDMHNFYGKREDGSVGYINTTKQFTGADKKRYADHLEALRDRESSMENYQLPNPNKPSLPSKLDVKALGGMLTKYTGQDHSTGRDGGIKVDQNGSPTATTGNQAVGLVEDGEVSYTHPETKQVYIFSKKIPYTI